MGVVTEARSGNIRCDDQIHYGADMRGYMDVYASTALTALTPYAIQFDEYGTFAAAIADNTSSYVIGVPEHSFAAGDIARLYVKGLVEDVITNELSMAVGHAFGILDTDFVDVGADYSGGATEWGICATTAASSTTHDIMLTGHLITGAT